MTLTLALLFIRCLYIILVVDSLVLLLVFIQLLISNFNWINLWCFINNRTRVLKYRLLVAFLQLFPTLRINLLSFLRLASLTVYCGTHISWLNLERALFAGWGRRTAMLLG